MANKWKKFDQSTHECYVGMLTGKTGITSWLKAFDVFRSILDNLRQENAAFPRTVEELEDDTEWVHDFYGWLEDYLDELDMHGQYRQLLDSVEYLLKTFDWSEGDGLDLRFHKAQCLWELGKTDQAHAYCKCWIKEEPENNLANAAYVSACIHKRTYQEAWDFVNGRMQDWDFCDEDAYPFYRAVDRLCDATGDKEKKKKIQKLIQECDERSEAEFEAWLEDEDLDDEEDDFFLPFE